MQVASYVVRVQFSCISTAASCQEGCAANCLHEQLLAAKKGEGKMLCFLHRRCRILAEDGTLCHTGIVKWLMGLAGPS